MYSPDGQSVFGSMRDYFSIMSDGEFTLTGYVLNGDPQKDGTPEWLTLPNTKNYYNNGSFSTFRSACFTAAFAAGLDISTNSSTKLAIVYAGHTYRTGGGLWPRASGSLYINGEKFAAGAPYGEERPDAKFTEIGVHCHEFGHLLGFNDLYANGFWDMMNAGSYSGPGLRCACPAPLNPETRYTKGWVDFDQVTVNQTFQSNYYLQDPEIFQIKKTSDPNRYWLIETRDFNATMTIGSTVTDDYNSWMLRNFFPNTEIEKGVLVWRVKPNNGGVILQADGNRWSSYPQITEGTPFPGTGNVEVLSPWSDNRSSPDWVPNTKPSLNVGTEIVGEGTDWYLIDLYVTDPEDASPSKPQNLSVDPSANNHPYATWDANTEPDISHYNVWKKKFYSGTWHWDILAQTENNYYEDVSEEYCPGFPSACVNQENIYFGVTVVDNQGKESVRSDSALAEVQGNPPSKRGVNNYQPNEQIAYSLEQNYPNPFNPKTQINYSILKDGFVTLKIYDILGNDLVTLVNERKTAGYYSVEFDASNLPSGIYFYKLTSGNYINTKKLLLLK